MKKILAFVFAMVMVLSLAACSVNVDTGNAGAGTAAAPAGTTAAPVETTTVPDETEPTQTETESTQAETEPQETEPAATETPVEAEYIVKEGTPAMGTVDGNYYTNESIGLTCAMPEGMEFASEAAILETNEVATADELLALDAAYIAITTDSSMAVVVYKMGTKEVNSKTTVAEALDYLIGDDTEYLEIRGATVAEPELVNAIFTAGTANAVILSAQSEGQQVVYLYVGYQVGEHLVVICAQAADEAGLEDILAGIDVE